MYVYDLNLQRVLIGSEIEADELIQVVFDTVEKVIVVGCIVLYVGAFEIFGGIVCTSVIG